MIDTSSVTPSLSGWLFFLEGGAFFKIKSQATKWGRRQLIFFFFFFSLADHFPHAPLPGHAFHQYDKKCRLIRFGSGDNVTSDVHPKKSGANQDEESGREFSTSAIPESIQTSSMSSPVRQTRRPMPAKTNHRLHINVGWYTTLDSSQCLCFILFQPLHLGFSLYS